MSRGRKTSANGRAVTGVLLALLGLPPLVALVEDVGFRVANANNGSIVSGGVRREYLLHVPASYRPGRPVPLVVSLHGAGGWPVLQRDLSGWNRLADDQGFLVVYPAGLGGGWSVSRDAGLDRDVSFLSDLLDEIERRYDVDTARVYVNGLSNGGGMAFVLSCTLSDRIAAIGTVAAAQTLPWSWCRDPAVVPLIAFHGTADTTVPFNGGTSWIGPIVFPDVRDWTARWARRNRCTAAGVETAVAPRVTRLEYADCQAGASVVLYTLLGGGHTWPGGAPLPEWFLGETIQSIDASREMWTFFQGHPSGPDPSGR